MYIVQRHAKSRPYVLEKTNAGNTDLRILRYARHHEQTARRSRVGIFEICACAILIVFYRILENYKLFTAFYHLSELRSREDLIKAMIENLDYSM